MVQDSTILGRRGADTEGVRTPFFSLVYFFMFDSYIREVANSLCCVTVSANMLNCFKSRLDK